MSLRAVVVSGISTPGQGIATRPNGIGLMIPWIVVWLTGCTGAVYPRPVFDLSVDPASVTVSVASTANFAAVFAPSAPRGGSLSWSVTPASGGTITNEGVYTASATAGRYSVVATWTASYPATDTRFAGSATVEVLPVGQISEELNPHLVQASGAVQTFGTIQNAVIVGQSVPSITSTDPADHIQVRSGFVPPVPCAKSESICQ
jgi:hypothetical protein